ncbi:hypothetical protein GGD81_001898 [Rhodobium orientis]|uniref:PRTase-CE domain-containing protein n=1 Tax=Rhodobium orientis TaxID=34017 RepID=A0A327JIV0_9HYPH|nr:hypothetical protein [Rhodobium orientis]MBB4302862.1 hypothetical protein [Rhodobium orientis]RAI26239.1 hypothetical protein CH339_14730 [Rhodobium orientis]
MKEVNAQEILAQVMGWIDSETVVKNSTRLQFLSEYKYNEYQRYGPGKQFIESLALWLNQFEEPDRPVALSLILDKLIFISEKEMSHLVKISYPDVIVQERLRLVAEEDEIPLHKVEALSRHWRFEELRIRSLYLGLSDGAHTNELRRASNGAISNEQIWQAYELGEAKTGDMLEALRKNVRKFRSDFNRSDDEEGRFNLVWLIDDFSGSGNTYIRYDNTERSYKGKIKKIYERIHEGDLVSREYYEVYILLYVATRQAIDHIEYWSERFAGEHGFKPPKVVVLHPIEKEYALTDPEDSDVIKIAKKEKYYDTRASDRHIAIGGTENAMMGFADCALPLVLSHNTPNNSIYLLWGPEEYAFFGLFPRVSRHRET